MNKVQLFVLWSAVIIILAGYVYPAFEHRGYKPPHHQSKCKNNIRNMLFGIQIYETDNNLYPDSLDRLKSTGLITKELLECKYETPFIYSSVTKMDLLNNETLPLIKHRHDPNQKTSMVGFTDSSVRLINEEELEIIIKKSQVR